jgi:hypothetical protein
LTIGEMMLGLKEIQSPALLLLLSQQQTTRPHRGKNDGNFGRLALSEPSASLALPLTVSLYVLVGVTY